MNGDGTDEYYRLLSPEGWWEPKNVEPLCEVCNGTRFVDDLDNDGAFVKCEWCPTPENVGTPTCTCVLVDAGSYLSPPEWQQDPDCPIHPSENVECPRCHNTGIVPCDNCEESDEHDCWIDGEMYGPYPCSCEAGEAIDQW